jgi:hypothetical protein
VNSSWRSITRPAASNARLQRAESAWSYPDRRRGRASRRVLRPRRRAFRGGRRAGQTRAG